MYICAHIYICLSTHAYPGQGSTRHGTIWQHVVVNQNWRAPRNASDIFFYAPAGQAGSDDVGQCRGSAGHEEGVRLVGRFNGTGIFGTMGARTLQAVP